MPSCARRRPSCFALNPASIISRTPPHSTTAEFPPLPLPSTAKRITGASLRGESASRKRFGRERSICARGAWLHGIGGFDLGLDAIAPGDADDLPAEAIIAY